MTTGQLRAEAARFRKAIEKAKSNIQFSYKDRMSRFPRGCCDDTADLFAHYLFRVFGVTTIRVDGAYYDGNPENNCSHSWQELDGIIIDLTGDQFEYNPVFLNYSESVYVGPIDDFHKLFEVERRVQSCGIESLASASWNRMYQLYNTIMQYLN